MKFIERLQNEKKNLTGNIIMYEDASKFIKVYERSAFMFVLTFKPMETLVYNNKEYGGPYVMMGFPKNSISSYINHSDFTYSKKEEGNLLIHTLIRKNPTDFPEEKYNEWKNKAIEANLQKQENKQRKSEVQSSVTTQDSIQETPDNTPNNGTDYKIKAVIDDIMSQQLSNYTPMQALNYLNSLQERIKNEGLSD